MCDECMPPCGLAANVDRRRLFAGAATIGAALALGVPQRSAARVRPAAVPVASGLSIHPRESWADAPPTSAMNAEDVRFLLVHHTAGSQPSPAQVPAELRAIYRFHTGPEKGWPDVCYNFLIDPHGGVWEGRAGSLVGPVEASATGGSQGFAQLVCLLGDFTSVLPTAAALDALTRTLVWLADRYRIDTRPDATASFTSRGSNLWPAGSSVVAATISGHRDMSRTACPGDTFYPHLTTHVRDTVHTARGGIVAAPPTSAPPSSSSSSPPTTTTTTTASSPPPSTSPPASTVAVPSSTEPAPAATPPSMTPTTSIDAGDAILTTIAAGAASAATLVPVTIAPTPDVRSPTSSRSTPTESTSTPLPDASAAGGIRPGRLLAIAGVAAAVAGGAKWFAGRESRPPTDRDTSTPPGLDDD